MKLFIDCEWNSEGGSLISMALVPEDGSTAFYEVLDCDNPHPWIAENVMPKLHKEHISLSRFKDLLEKYLSQFDSIHVVADWPEDIARFCMALVEFGGNRLNTPPLTMEVLRVESVSANPHNALADAQGLARHLGYPK